MDERKKIVMILNNLKKVKFCWDKKLYKNFVQKRKRLNWIGYDFNGVFTTYGKSFLLPESMCVQIKKKRKKSLRTVLRFKRDIGNQGYYYNFLYYFVKLGWFKLNRKIYSKNIRLSRITNSRLMK